MPLIIGINKQIGIGDVTAKPTDNLQAIFDSLVDGQVLALENGIYTPSTNAVKTLQESRRGFGGQTNTGSFSDANTRRGQLFTTQNQAVSLVSVDLGAVTFGSIVTNPNVIMEIFNTASNLPTGAVLGTSQGIPLNTFPNTFPTDINLRKRFTFPTPVPLLANTTYAFSIKLSAADSGGAFISYQLAAIGKIVIGFGEVISSNGGSTWATGGNEDITNWNVNVRAPGYTLSKRIQMIGRGNDTVLNGDFELATGSGRSDISKLKINGALTVRTNECIVRGWHSNAGTVDDRGLDNDIRVVGEN